MTAYVADMKAHLINTVSQTRQQVKQHILKYAVIWDYFLCQDEIFQQQITRILQTNGVHQQHNNTNRN
jgi:hypothetical protein